MAKAKTEQMEKQRIITPEFWVFFPHVFKPQGLQGAEPKYSVTMAFKKTQDLSTVKQAITQAKITAFGPTKESWPKGIASPVTDGDNEKYADREEYHGHWLIKASSSQDNKPGVVDEEVQPIMDPSVFYPGCYARAQVFARVWEFPKGSGRYGVHFILDHVQKTRDGKKLGGKKDASEVFNPIAATSNNDDAGEEEEQGF